MCFLCVAPRLHDAYAGAGVLEHRGEDCTGLFALRSDFSGIDGAKWEGGVSNFRNKPLQELFPQDRYCSFGIHGRYRTAGSTKTDLREGHPHFIGGEVEGNGSFVIVKGAKMAIIHNGQFEQRFFAGVDTKGVKTNCDSEIGLHMYEQKGLEYMLMNVPDGYSLAIADAEKKGVFIARGRHGLKPLVRGTKDGTDIVASESVALRELRAEYRGDIIPGAIYFLDGKGLLNRPLRIVEPCRRHCMFEGNYFAHPHSVIERTHVLSLREQLGEALTEEFPLKPDFVTHIPESPFHAARAYADAVGAEFLPTFLKVKGKRSFLHSEQGRRAESINTNLFPISGAVDRIKAVKGSLVIIDDSSVRGTVLERVSQIVQEAKLNVLYFLSYTPRIGIILPDGTPVGCDHGGVDMPTVENSHHRFISRHYTPEQISEMYKMPVGFLSVGGMLGAYERLGRRRENLCYRCVGGPHPFRDFVPLTVASSS